MDRRLADLLPTRRDALKWGGVALASSWVDGLVWPLDVRAQGTATPRGTARNCIFIELGGAISPMDTWDFKETRWTPKDLDVTEVTKGLYLSRTLFPQLVERMDKVALVRSLQAPELIHFNGQYHTQTGRSLNPAVAREIPAFGSVISYELGPKRRESDAFPTYVSTNLTKARAGSLGSGLPADVVHRPRPRPEHRVRRVRRRHDRRQPGAVGALAAADRAGQDQRGPARGDGPARRRLPDLLRRRLQAAAGPALAEGVHGQRRRQAALRRRRVRARLHPGPQPAAAERRHAHGLRLRRRPLGSPRRHLRQVGGVEPLPDLHPARQGAGQPDRRPERAARDGARQDDARRDADRRAERVRPHARA